MIGRIHGDLVSLDGDQAIIDVRGVGYEVTVSPVLAERLRRLGAEAEVTLITYHYLQSDPSKAMPVLIGFETTEQRDFFLELCSVARLGAKGAVKALSMPISRIARAIEIGDAKSLQVLPGIGRQKAKDIIAKLQGRMGRYIGIDEHGADELPPLRPEALAIQDEALEICLQIGLKQADALKEIADIMAAQPDIASSERLIEEIFKRRGAGIARP
jgi:Holliday junction DNA helicase RuvA